MNSSEQGKIRQPRAVTRATILAKAYEMYLARKLVHGDERLSPVLDELGYAATAGYRIWGSNEAFREDLLIYVAENVSSVSLGSIADQLVDFQYGSLRDRLLTIGDRYAEMYLNSEEFIIMLRFFAAGEDRAPEITDALAEAYERSNWEAVQLFSVAMEYSGLKMRDGFEIADLTTAITALVEGFALRGQAQAEALASRVDHSGLSHHLFSFAFVAMVESMTEAADR